MGWFNYHGSRRMFRCLAQLHHKCLASCNTRYKCTELRGRILRFTDSIETSRKNLHRCDTTGHDKLNGVVMGVKRVNGPQPRQNRTLIRVYIEGS